MIKEGDMVLYQLPRTFRSMNKMKKETLLMKGKVKQIRGKSVIIEGPGDELHNRSLKQVRAITDLWDST